MAQELKGKTFQQMCEVKDRQGSFYIVRKGKNHTRVVTVDKVE